MKLYFAVIFSNNRLFFLSFLKRFFSVPTINQRWMDPPIKVHPRLSRFSVIVTIKPNQHFFSFLLVDSKLNTKKVQILPCGKRKPKYLVSLKKFISFSVTSKVLYYKCKIRLFISSHTYLES